MANRFPIAISYDNEEPAFGSVTVRNLDPGFLVRLRSEEQAYELLRSMFRVAVAQKTCATNSALPDVFGRYQLMEGGVRFTPHFPFEPGIVYRASFDPRPSDRLDISEFQTLEFSLPRTESSLPTEVQHIFPSDECLPENLLRFYVVFSNSMQRGRAEAEIAVLGPDGEPTPDVLYRAPIELWDKRMQCLTILLDPGRLKRGVGPNRELGPPLKADRAYKLAIGAGMLDITGRRLTAAAEKRFRVTKALREPIAVEHWKTVFPASQSLDALVLIFPQPLDWALLANTLAVTSEGDRLINGRIAIDQDERRWKFTPISPWAPGSYNVQVGSSLEDVCGNSVIAAFDRPLRSGTDSQHPVTGRLIAFHVG